MLKLYSSSLLSGSRMYSLVILWVFAITFSYNKLEVGPEYIREKLVLTFSFWTVGFEIAFVEDTKPWWKR